jgi:hypothetical protein
MRQIFLGLLLITSTLLSGQDVSIKYFYGKWKQFGYKNHKDSTVRTSNEDCANKILEFSKDGRYEEEMYSITSKGRWQFNADSTRFGIILSEVMGRKINQNNLPASFNSIILKLSRDTLIIGQEAYYVPEKIKGHDDWYYHRRK